MNNRILVRVVPVAAIAAMVVGLVVMIQSEARPTTFGWFAYSPLPESSGTLEGLHVVSTAGLVGALVLAAGLMVLVFWMGLRLGARRRRAHHG